jgi:hypothetical protein
MSKLNDFYKRAETDSALEASISGYLTHRLVDMRRDLRACISN